MMEKEARIREAMSRALCAMDDADPDYRMWDGQPLWQWRLRTTDGRARVEAAIAALTATGARGERHNWG